MTDGTGKLPVPGQWQPATVTAVWPETPSAKTFRLELEQPSPHLAGQHYMIRLTASDGYRTSRSYSVASAPDGTATVELTVERLDDGEVSSFLHEIVAPGDTLEVRGPIGGWFVWRGDTPALLVGGGSGVVPLMAMLRLARNLGRSNLVRLVVSARSPAELYYAKELGGPEVKVVFTRVTSEQVRPAGRLRLDDLPLPLEPATTGYVCGSSGFVESAASLLQEAALPTGRIRIERFGPTR